MSTSEAWLLDCGDGLSIAVGDHQFVELLPADADCREPGENADGTLAWQQSRVPLLELGRPAAAGGAGYHCILYFQQAPDTPLRAAAIRVYGAPERIRIDDTQACELPPEHRNAALAGAVLSCFVHEEKAVLILDIAALCGVDSAALAVAGS